MKAKFLFVLAAVALVFTACRKEKPTPKNELTWNGETREVVGSVSVEQQGTAYYITCHTPMENEEGHPDYTFECETSKNGLNKTFDLAGGHGTDPSYLIFANKFCSPDKHWFYNSSYTNFADEWGGHINGTNFENTSIFKSGTMTITLDDEALALSLDGVLKDDDTFSVELFIPKEYFISR